MADNKHTDGVDKRSGTYDAISPAGKQQRHQVKDATSSHEAAQEGADVRADPLPGGADPLPEGLVRPRKGPLNRDHGRG